MKNRNYYRTWLNSKEGTAFVVASVEDGYASLSIADCSRSINLDFGVGRRSDKDYKREVREKLAKLNRLRKALDVIEKALNDAS